MEQVFFGRTGMRISKLGLGTMSFGGDADEATSRALFERARDAGVTFFDCANVYAKGRSEEILGRLIAPCRDEVVLATKAYFPSGRGANARGGSRYHLVRAVEASLRRLSTDRVDVFYLHRFDDDTPLEETLRGVEQLVAQGKVLYPAVSNFTAWQTARALGVQERHGWAPLVGTQPMYNLVKRTAEIEILPMAEAEGLAVTPYSPLGGGLLSGKYGREARPEAGRIVDNPMYGERYGHAWVYEVAERFTALARERGLHPVTLAVAWVAAHPAVTAPLVGARSVAQLEPALAAAELTLDEELHAAVSALSPAPPPATDRNEEAGSHDYASLLRK
ncbi:MAG TPA: aldo/keto reductase [Sandaracinaceae bacterium LLY-WYZ-13_1]|nr:aldo/keto reductase [Sandaracinaceae bacterium LLY-WYZ-13_1]